MKQDYAKSKNSRKRTTRRSKKNNSKKAPLILWLFVITLVILFIGGLVYLKSFRGTALKPKTQTSKVSKATKTIKQTKQAPRFDYYNILPKLTVPVPNANNQQANSNQNQYNGEYALQIASLKEFKDADSLRAQLILNGYNVLVKTSNSNGTTWYRVMIGPYTSYARAEQAKINLQQQQNKKGLIVKLSG